MKNLFYHLLKQYIRVVLWFYFKRWQVRNIVPVPNGPVIFVANHQNAFLDAIILGCSSSRNPWFLTRANVFQNNLVKKIFNTLKMTPVYRFRDGFSTLRKNDEVIDNCVQLLSQGEAILIFGEGNHDEHWRLRPLQKGFARIAIAAEEKNNWTLGVKIVPIGIQYDSHSKFRSRVLVTFGEAILVKNIVKPNLSQPEQIEILLGITSETLKPLILHIEQPDYEKKQEYYLQNRIIESDLVEQLKADQEIVLNTPPIIVTNSGIKRSSDGIEKWFNPIFLYGFINHLLPRTIISWVLKTKVKDPQFIGSLKFALGMVLVPIFYVLQTSLCYALSGSWVISGIYLLSLPLSILLRD
ncbi:MAG: 1-acyl-sn-glycerol-3-phosphate acyltransferase [Bacteroidia bacterium]|nr:1-acyl-sn-glycerol-3-phosphate acyltransferase [Bacteroidia bacterium]